MRILVVSKYYRPDGGPAAPLYTLLCERLAQRGHEVTVLTAVPHYPSGRVAKGFRGFWVRQTVENGVKVFRIPLPSVNRSRLPSRLFQFAVFQLRATLAGLGLKYDLILTHTPSLEVLLPFAYFAVIRHKPSVYSVHDVYPDVGVKLGIFHNPKLIWVIGLLEKFCLRKATRVRVLSRSFIPTVQQMGVPDDRICLLYDWVDTDRIKGMARDNSFAREYGLIEPFVVLYAGNLGFVQGLETVLDSANLLKDRKDIRFVFVGDGGAKQELQNIAIQHNLRNVDFIPYQPLERMAEVFSTADVCLVSLKKGTGFGALPSKTFSILASERPVIACVDEGTDTWDLVKKAAAGVCVKPEDPESLVNAILALQQNDRLRLDYGKNGREYILKYHSPDTAALAFEKLIQNIINP